MSGDLRLSLRGFMVPKQGDPPSSCRDAWQANPRRELPFPASLRVAVADGASTASASGLWAEVLVFWSVISKAPWTRNHYRTRILERAHATWYLKALGALSQPIPWFAENALAKGAFATLLKVEIEGNTWRAEAWGDSCLFHLRRGYTVQVLPDLEPEAFAQNPFLLASIACHDSDLVKQMVSDSGRLERGDILILATDALACWFLTTDTWPETLRELARVRSDEAFAAWVDGLRRERGLKNDDTTLVLVECV